MKLAEAFVALAGLLAVMAAAPALPQPAGLSGQEIYGKRCAGCHEQASERIPQRDALQRMPASRIVRALDSGAMMAVALTMSREERLAVAAYLGTKDAVAGPPAAAFCKDRTVRLAAAGGWNGWSPRPDSARFQPAAAAGLSAREVPRLKLKWAFGFDGDVAAFAPVSVLGDHLFVGSAGGVVHAMRADSGCLDWVYQANGPVRSGVVAAPLSGGRHALLFGDMTGWFYAVVAESGKELWKVRVDPHDSTRLTGTPLAHDGVVYVPVSSWEETRATDADYACCTFRGSLAAYRISDGKSLWRTWMVGEPKPVGKTRMGTAILGPSGVAIWSTPTIDPSTRTLYVTTGDNYSPPATPLSDAVVALDPATGRIRWSKQLTENDVFNSSCTGDKQNCPDDAGPDHDFGSSAIPITVGKRHLLLAGQKSGIVYALDADRQGAVVWQARVGEGGANGGVQWGMATDGRLVYAATSDPGRTRNTGNPLDTRRYILDPQKGGGLTALRIADGSKVWAAAAPACPEGAPSGCSPSQPGALTGIPGVVFATSTTGDIRAHAAADGRLLWSFNTMRDFATVNGVKARGGSIDGPGPVVAKGMVFVSSGYPRNGGVPGNVLLAFAPE